MKLFIFLAAFLSAYACLGANLWGPIKARETLVVGDKSGDIDTSALLELYSTTAGFLPPTMTTAQRDAIGSPATFLMIGNSTTGFLQIYDGANWTNIGVGGFTANRALKVDASGNIIVSTVTDTELEYLSGVTSAIQTQLNAKAPLTLTTDGDILYYNSGHQRLAKGTDDQVLTLSSGIPAWADAAVGADGESVGGVNYLKNYNPGFEKGDATNWTNAGSGSFSVETSTNGEGAYYGKWNAAADDDTLTMDAATVPGFLKKNNAVFCLRYKGGDANQRFVINDGTNDFIDETLAVHADWTALCVNAVMPDVSSVTLRLEADADAAEILVDTFFMGDANRVNISKVSSAEIWGTIKWKATDCNWTGNSATWANFSVDSDCDFPTGENLTNHAEAPDTKIPGVKFTNMPPGEYLFVAPGYLQTSVTSGTTAVGYWRISDGTKYTVSNVSRIAASSANNSVAMGQIIGRIRYTGTATRTFQIQQKLDAGTVQTIVASTANDRELEISVYRFPLSSETAYTPTTKMLYSGVKIAADAAHDFVTTSATYAKATDSDIVSGDKTHFGQATITSTAGDFGFQMPTIQPGKYYIYYRITLLGEYASSNTNCIWGISDDGGTTIYADETNVADSSSDLQYINSGSGYINYDSIQTNKEFTIYTKRVSGGGNCRVRNITASAEIGIIPAGESVNMPQILNNVESSASGGVKIFGATITNDGSATIESQDGAWLTSVSRTAGGSINATPTTNNFSTAPRCWCDAEHSEVFCVVFVNSVSDIQIRTRSHAGTLTDTDVDLFCIGAK